MRIENRLQTRDRRLQTSNNRLIFVFAFCLQSLVSSLWSPACFAQMSFDDAEAKAAEAHKLAASDVIYQEQDWKALYYQNLQMIGLLQDIKQELEKLNANESKDENKKEKI